eukprot:TRINITY_DN18471_c0_g1_i1.p1 TRINITY_DN18471_c0_g1~~TRINITY_DN18471_c0_g1_i1.p1  ORF type:complete len:202 (+),score=19.99 TRINITY_DN18471_c0_g1_i1:46-651(+)
MSIAFQTDDHRGLPDECRLPDGGFWVFGYGSMIWKVTFPMVEEIDACVKGYERRFWQGSADHRGTVENPGRVCALVKAAGDAEVWGKAYRISGHDAEAVLSELDDREKGGYSSTSAGITHPASQEQISALLFVTLPANANMIHAEDDELTAQVISTAHGPSGPNTEYLFNLNKALHAMGKIDPYCENLEKLVRAKLRGHSP